MLRFLYVIFKKHAVTPLQKRSKRIPYALVSLVFRGHDCRKYALLDLGSYWILQIVYNYVFRISRVKKNDRRPVNKHRSGSTRKISS